MKITGASFAQQPGRRPVITATVELELEAFPAFIASTSDVDVSALQLELISQQTAETKAAEATR